MLLYCLKFRKNAESTNPKVVNAKKERKMLLSNVKSGIVKNQLVYQRARS